MEISRKTLLHATVLFFLILLVCCTDNVNPDNPDKDPHVPLEDPVEITGKAMVCFDHANTCKPEQRLSPIGTIDVPRDQTDEYCNGGCYGQTQMVLTCMDQIMSNFEFYNKATIDIISETITEACSNTDKRGDFNVAERMQSTSDASKRLTADVSCLGILVTLCEMIFMVSQIMGLF